MEAQSAGKMSNLSLRFKVNFLYFFLFLSNRHRVTLCDRYFVSPRPSTIWMTSVVPLSIFPLVFKYTVTSSSAS
jgi:hypothetical protein